VIKYRYSLVRDIKNAIWTINDRKWFKEHSSIVKFWPNPIRWLWLLFWIISTKKPNIETEESIVCYWVSSGTWGAYHPDDMSISICPWKLEQCPDDLEELIKHEILHLEHPEMDTLEHEKKERLIENLSKR